MGGGARAVLVPCDRQADDGWLLACWSLRISSWYPAIDRLMMPQVGIKEFFAFDSNTFVQASAQMGQNTIRREITRLSCHPSLTHVILSAAKDLGALRMGSFAL